jgi:hypothetical protein
VPGEPISIVDETIVYRDDAVEIYQDQVRLDGGGQADYLRVVEQQGRPAVAALALSQGLVALVRTYRYPTGTYEWAIPRGFSRGADPRQGLSDELTTHVGAAPDELEDLAVVTPHSTLAATRVHVFLARYRAPLLPAPVRHQPAALRWEPLKQLKTEIRSGKITDGITLAALGAALLQGIEL